MANSQIDRETSVYIAELAQKAERYDDMVIEMNNVANMVENLTEDERKLLSVAYKNAIGPRMESWRILSVIEQDKRSRSNETNVGRINGYKLKVESEIIKICGDILSIIEKHFIPKNSTPVDSLFYYKMKGDYYMYLGELKTGDDKEEYARRSQEAYENAMLQGVNTKLPRAHPYRLDLAMSFSIFLKVINKSPKWACKMVKDAIDEAKIGLDRLNDEEAKKESTHILDKLFLLYAESQGTMLGPVDEGEKKLQDEPDLEDEEHDYDADDDVGVEHDDDADDEEDEPFACISEQGIIDRMILDGKRMSPYICASFFPVANEVHVDVMADFKVPYELSMITTANVSTLARPGEEDGFDSCDIQLVMDQTSCVTRAEAIEALKNNNGDLVDAIMELVYNYRSFID